MIDNKSVLAFCEPFFNFYPKMPRINIAASMVVTNDICTNVETAKVIEEDIIV